MLLQKDYLHLTRHMRKCVRVCVCFQNNQFAFILKGAVSEHTVFVTVHVFRLYKYPLELHASGHCQNTFYLEFYMLEMFRNRMECTHTNAGQTSENSQWPSQG